MKNFTRSETKKERVKMDKKKGIFYTIVSATAFGLTPLLCASANKKSIRYTGFIYCLQGTEN